MIIEVKLSKMVWSLVTILPVFKSLLISKCPRRFRRNPFLPGWRRLILYLENVWLFSMQWAEKPVVLSPLVIDLKCSVARIPKFLPVWKKCNNEVRVNWYWALFNDFATTVVSGTNVFGWSWDYEVWHVIFSSSNQLCHSVMSYWGLRFVIIMLCVSTNEPVQLTAPKSLFPHVERRRVEPT